MCSADAAWKAWTVVEQPQRRPPKPLSNSVRGPTKGLRRSASAASCAAGGGVETPQRRPQVRATRFGEDLITARDLQTAKVHWICSDCDEHNRAERQQCNNCGAAASHKTPISGTSSASSSRSLLRSSSAGLATPRGGQGKDMKQRPEVPFEQNQSFSRLAVSRRTRFVASTLESLGEDYNPSAGLEAAAASLAAEEAAREKAKREQHKMIAALSQPKLQPEAEEPEVLEGAPRRTFEEQQAYLDQLTKAREMPDPVAEAPARVLRTAAEQQEYLSGLSQPRGGAEALEEARRRREELAARASALAPDEVRAAQALLLEMRGHAASCPGGARPSSGRPRSSGRGRAEQAAAPSEEELQRRSEQQAELRSLVEEVLWTALLQVRCCRKAPGAPPAGNAAAGGLEERLANLLISVIGQTLRPIARRMLAPGVSLARKIRQEFPRLATHLGFRESDDMELPALAWTSDETAQRVSEVRACRDKLLAMDMTKMIMDMMVSSS
eukprot:TRINITY_DN10600_c0_g1_i1.p1 TRINITY_DN10600_c0_g1~~TRINITY_DN10600_c0_g1_i1.p1  ORF type:complete len:498 (+),score=117.69 TRINITY_DN10600_c0_g1_i1:116-1609(+)